MGPSGYINLLGTGKSTLLNYIACNLLTSLHIKGSRKLNSK